MFGLDAVSNFIFSLHFSCMLIAWLIPDELTTDEKTRLASGNEIQATAVVGDGLETLSIRLRKCGDETHVYVTPPAIRMSCLCIGKTQYRNNQSLLWDSLQVLIIQLVYLLMQMRMVMKILHGGLITALTYRVILRKHAILMYCPSH